jgi:pimeloyl-ACP methyl ester carboxylesterase
MRIFIDAFDGPGTFDRLPEERRAIVMANARFFRAITSSSDPFPDVLRERVRQLRMPALVVSGENTDELHKLVTEELARVMPGAERAIIRQAGHGSPRQNPAAFNEAVLAFLSRHAAGVR